MPSTDLGGPPFNSTIHQPLCSHGIPHSDGSGPFLTDASTHWSAFLPMSMDPPQRVQPTFGCGHSPYAASRHRPKSGLDDSPGTVASWMGSGWQSPSRASPRHPRASAHGRDPWGRPPNLEGSGPSPLSSTLVRSLPRRSPVHPVWGRSLHFTPLPHPSRRCEADPSSSLPLLSFVGHIGRRHKRVSSRNDCGTPGPPLRGMVVHH